MTDQEILEIIKQEVGREIADHIEKAHLPIEIIERQPSEGELDNDVELTFIAKMKNFAIYAKKKAQKIVGYVLYALSLYGAIQIGGELLYPDSVPSAIQLVKDARKGILHIAENVPKKEDQKEKFIVVRESWLTASPDQYFTLVTSDDKKGVDGLVGIHQNDMYMFPASGYTGISGSYITSGGNV